MKSITILRGLFESLRKRENGGFPAHRRPNAQAKTRPTFRAQVEERLETRLALTSPALALPTVAMVDVSTADSQSVTLDYRVSAVPGSNSSQPLTFGIYRSTDAKFDSTDVAVPNAGLIQVKVDDSGGPAAAEGAHRVTIKLPDGLPIDTAHPYVLAVANPQGASATTDPSQTASFRKYTIGVVTHGGIQNQSWKNGPPWQLQIGTLMRQQGYDAVIPYNWVRESSTPGAAVKQGPRLANMILKVSADFNSSDPVDLHLVGHSQGTVVNTIALARLESEATPQIAAGYVKDTLLDPHPATNDVPGRDFSTESTILGGIADIYIKSYQGDARDPQVFIPDTVDKAEVFYQHSKAPSGSIYNLWGRVPVAHAGDETHYYNLTPMGTTHSGKKGVQSWYLNFIAPTLSQQTPLLKALELDGSLATPSTSTTVGNRVQRTITANQAKFAGTATPGATVRLYVGPSADPSTIANAGETTADANGHWSISTRSLSNGSFRAVVMSSSQALRTRPGLAVVSMDPLGTFQVDKTS